jgi:hypothetical protein
LNRPDQPASPAHAVEPTEIPFSVYAAIASAALQQAAVERNEAVSNIKEIFKTMCAKQGKPYPTEPQRAVDAAIVARDKKARELRELIAGRRATTPWADLPRRLRRGGRRGRGQARGPAERFAAMSKDPVWTELVELAHRAAPRYDPERYGRCDLCGLGPTFVAVLSRIVWVCCLPCGQRCRLDVPSLDHDPELCQRAYRVLASCSECSRSESHNQETTSMLRRKPQPRTRALDVFDLLDEQQQRFSILSNVEPSCRRFMTTRTVDFLNKSTKGGALVRPLQELRFPLWEALRGESFDHTQRTVEESLRETNGTPEQVMRALLAGGSLLETLRRRRQELDGVIEMIEAVGVPEIR